jgi:cytochrome c553
MAASLTESDVAALASYYARQKARAFVFVAVPAR